VFRVVVQVTEESAVGFLPVGEQSLHGRSMADAGTPRQCVFLGRPPDVDGGSCQFPVARFQKGTGGAGNLCNP
jgi:hypothetical protein